MTTATKTTPRYRHRRAETIDKYMTEIPYTIGKEQVLATAHRMMREHAIRHLPVLEGGKLVGLVSDRDLKLIETLKDVDPHQIAVEEAMTAEPYQAAPTASLETVVREMARKKYGAVVVVDDDRVVGIFTAVDALETLAWFLDRNGD